MLKQARCFTVFIIFSLVCRIQAQYVPPEALVEPIKPAGIRISIPRKSIYQKFSLLLKLNIFQGFFWKNFQLIIKGFLRYF